MLLQHLLEISSGVGLWMSRHLLRGARHHDFAPLITAYRTEIDDQVGVADHIEVVLRYPKILVGI